MELIGANGMKTGPEARLSEDLHDIIIMRSRDNVHAVHTHRKSKMGPVGARDMITGPMTVRDHA
jgi:hypothetical protein